MHLSAHFSLEEFTKSTTATRLGIANNPSLKEIDALVTLCEFVLEPIREKFGPVTVVSGFRGPELNKATPGSSKTSQHVLGEAADIEIKGIKNYDLFIWIKENLKFDQLILEFVDPKVPESGWIHVSYRPDRLPCTLLEAVRSADGKTEYRTWKPPA